MGDRVLCITQARMGSSRLPGKVLRQCLGRPLLQYHIEQLRKARSIEQLVVATSTEAGDDAIEAFCIEAGVACFRGSEQDVLDRFYQCALAEGAETVIRVTADCPLIDPALVDLLVAGYQAADGALDYACLDVDRLPRGLDAEIFSFAALQTAWREATRQNEREHVTPFIYGHPDRFELATVCPDNADHGDYRLCVDEQADFDVVSGILRALYQEGASLSWRRITGFLDENPKLKARNQGVQQRHSGVSG